jgi:hypothetical protein
MTPAKFAGRENRLDHGQILAAAATPTAENLATIGRFHPGTEAVLANPLDIAVATFNLHI